MVLPTEVSPTILPSIGIRLKKRKTSACTNNDDLMNTAFYEPEYELEPEIITKNQTIEGMKRDHWEERLERLSKEHPFLMLRFVPVIIELLLILLITVFFTKTGATSSVDKVAAQLYYLIFCLMF